MVVWSIVAASQCALNGRASFLCTRSLLGLLEVSELELVNKLSPDWPAASPLALLGLTCIISFAPRRRGVLFLTSSSGYHTSTTLGSYRLDSGKYKTRKRLHLHQRAAEFPVIHLIHPPSYFWTSLSVTGILTSLLAFALLHLRGVAGWGGWRWLFLVEGLITLLVGIASFFMMPASAVQTKTWFRPKGWFTDRELGIAVNRILRDDPSKGDMHNRQAITPKRLWEALKDYDLWPIYAIGLVVYQPQSPPGKYLTLILRSLGFNPFNTNLLTIPSVSPCLTSFTFLSPLAHSIRFAKTGVRKMGFLLLSSSHTSFEKNVFHIINLLAITRLSDWLKERALVSMIQAIWTLPCVLALRFWPGFIHDSWGTYALVLILVSYPYCRK